VAELHTFRVAGQSVLLAQPTQTPVDIVQIGASNGQPMVAVQPAWHVWSAGQQTGVLVIPQSVLLRQATHEPLRQ
jgi:hypothetical protein